MKLEILSFTWNLFRSDTVISITSNTKSWQITILNNHAPLVSVLIPWIIKVVYINEVWLKEEKDFAIWWWILEVSNSQVKLLINMLISVDILDIQEAEHAKHKALELMDRYKGSKDRVEMERFIEAEDMLLKSLAQLKLWHLSK